MTPTQRTLAHTHASHTVCVYHLSLSPRNPPYPTHPSLLFFPFSSLLLGITLLLLLLLLSPKTLLPPHFFGKLGFLRSWLPSHCERFTAHGSQKQTQGLALLFQSLQSWGSPHWDFPSFPFLWLLCFPPLLRGLEILHHGLFFNLFFVVLVSVSLFIFCFWKINYFRDI